MPVLNIPSLPLISSPEEAFYLGNLTSNIIVETPD